MEAVYRLRQVSTEMSMRTPTTTPMATPSATTTSTPKQTHKRYDTKKICAEKLTSKLLVCSSI